MEDFDIKELVDTITGNDEEGLPKAFSSLQHQMLFIDDEDIEPEIIDEASTAYATAGITVSDGMATAILKFQSFDDIDFIRMHAVCKNFENREFGERTELLVLTLVDNETYSNFVSMVVHLVSFDGAEPIIRFMASSNNTRAFTIDDLDVDDEDYDDYDDYDEDDYDF
jgi:hypothetical protein